VDAATVFAVVVYDHRIILVNASIIVEDAGFTALDASASQRPPEPFRRP